MTTYTVNTGSGVITKDDGSIVPQNDTVQAYQDYVAWLAAGNTPTAVTGDPVVVYPNRHITVLALRNRFSQAEKIAIDLASIDNPSSSTQVRAAAAALRVYQKDLDNATYVDLDRAGTQAGIRALEQYGILGTGRADEIINNPILPIERPTSHDYLTA